MNEEEIEMVDGLIKKKPFEILTTDQGVFCPYCGMEEAEHPDNVIEYTFEETPNVCFDCGETYIVERQIITTYISKRKDDTTHKTK